MKRKLAKDLPPLPGELNGQILTSAFLDYREMHHRTTMTLDSDRVSIHLAGFGGDYLTHDPIESTDPAVVAFCRQIEQVRILTSWRYAQSLPSGDGAA